MANDLRRVMTNFEQSIKEAGLPEPPKLSKLLFSQSSSPSRKSSARQTYPDGMEITVDTVPGWYEIAGEQKYITAQDIPSNKVYDGGSKRGTLSLGLKPRGTYNIKPRETGLR